ncbi:unnamed protein product [Rotaria sordida]|uniref:Alpha/beta hydrolase fold-3 domain-containing protein n=1 Tax=Rotaria sordida TaxID=392033 RepID=A0A819K1S4_9BILA|nr:unnamed protein product [Rotaria sordida]
MSNYSSFVKSETEFEYTNNELTYESISSINTNIENDEEQLKKKIQFVRIKIYLIQQTSECNKQICVRYVSFDPSLTKVVRRRRVIESIYLHVQQKKNIFEKLIQLFNGTKSSTIYELGLQFLYVYNGLFNYREGHTFVMFFSKDPRFNNETLALLQFLAQNPLPQDIEVETLRLYAEDIHQKINKKLHETFKGTIEEKTVKTNSTEIPITIYTPLNVNKDKLVIYFHGGGWVVCSPKTTQTIVNYTADVTKTIWISVEYRLGPEYKYPIWLDDALDVTQHIIQNRTAYGVNETAKIGVAGDSAGGMISASLSHLLKGIDFQILIYAALDILGETPSYKEFANPMYFLTPELMKWYSTHAFHNLDDVKDPRASVLLNRTFEGLPPCLFIVADLDILRDGNLEYQKLLEKAGVQTKLVLMKNVIHLFFTLPGIFPQTCAEATDAIRDFVASI